MRRAIVLPLVLGPTLCASAFAQVSASWINPLNGNWTDPTAWSTNPFFPGNGNPAGTTYDVTIAAAGSSYGINFANVSVQVNTLDLRAPGARLSLNSGGLMLGAAGLPDDASPLRVGNGSTLVVSSSTLNFVSDDHISYVGVNGSGRLVQATGTVVKRGFLAVGIGGGSFSSGEGSLELSGGQWAPAPASFFNDATVIGVGPLGTGSLSMDDDSTATFSDLSVGAGGGTGFLKVEGAAELISNRLSIGNGHWSIGGSGTAGFGVATLSNANARVTLASLDGSLPGLLSIGGSAGLGSGAMIVTAGNLTTDFLRVSSTGSLDVRGGTVEFDLSVPMDGKILLSGTGSIIARTLNVTTGGELNVSGGSLSASRLTTGSSSSVNQLINITGGALSIGSFTHSSGSATVNGPAVVESQSIEINGGAQFNLLNGSVFTHSLSMTGGDLEFAGGTLDVASITVSGGRLTLTPGAEVRLDPRSLVVDNSGVLDIGDNPVTIDYAAISPIAEVAEDVASAHNGGDWSGPGITSSLADADTLGVGYADFASATIVVRLTRYGDANLSGTVNTDDFNALASAFGTAGKFWQDGDFNYNGIVNSDDFNLLAGNFGLSAGPDGIVDPSDWAALAAAVPEPGWLSLAAVAAFLLSRRRD